ncbi:MAG: hypothetical protein WDN45_15070 [Caulobacteraceae bacterium]
MMQPLALLLDMAGEAMRARLFVVQADGIDEACLRPDFTIPVASAHIASGQGERPLRLRGQGLPGGAAPAPRRPRSSCRWGWRAWARPTRARPTPSPWCWPGPPPPPADART